MTNMNLQMKNFGETSLRNGQSEILKESYEAMLVHLHHKELALILSLREKFTDGDVTVTMRQGIPQYVKRVVEVDNLNRFVGDK